MITLTPKQQEIYQQRLNLDLANRSITGTFIYIFVWIVISCNMIYKDSRDSLLTWLFAITGILVLVSIYRALMISLVKQQTYSLRTQHQLLISGAFVSSLAWGVICALSYLDTPLNQHDDVLLLSTVALSAGGTVTLFASKAVLNALLMGLLLPILVVHFTLLDRPDYEVCSIILIFLFGLLNGSKNVCAQYSNSLAQNIMLEDLSSKDPLTGLKNRGFFDDQLETEYHLALMHEHHRPLSIILLDIDHFKSVNDNYGHPVGDQFIRAVAAILLAKYGESEHTVARYGGEEFVLLMTKTDQKKNAQIAEELRLAIEQLRIQEGDDMLTITASMGCYTLDSYGGSITTEDMLRYADEALYDSKNNGRNRITVYSGVEHS